MRSMSTVSSTRNGASELASVGSGRCRPDPALARDLCPELPLGQSRADCPSSGPDVRATLARMEDRSARVLRAASSISVLSLALALWVVSFSWMDVGPASSALLGSGLLVISIAVGVLASGRVIERPRLSLDTLTTHRHGAMVVGFALLAVFGLMVSAALHDEPSYLDGRTASLARLTTLFVLAHVAVAVAVRPGSPEQRPRLSRLASSVVVAIIAVIIALYVRAGVNPVDAYADALDAGAFGPILRSIRDIHLDLGDPGVTSTIRHIEIRGALCAAFLGLALIGHPTRRSVRWSLVALALAATLAVLQFSRANLLIVALTAAVPLALAVARSGPRIRATLLGAVIVSIVLVVSVDVSRDALLDGSNRSSEVRTEALEDSIGLLDDAMPIGITEAQYDRDLGRSPHNMFLDLTLGAGLIGSSAALGLIAVATWALVGTIRAQFGAASMVHVLPAIGISGLLFIVIVRMLTGGGGLLDPVSWIAFGSATALLAMREREAVGVSE